MIRATGLRLATSEQRAVVPIYHASKIDAVFSCNYTVRIVGSAIYAQQEIARIIDQGRLPACVGCAMCAIAEAVIGIPPHLSWVRIWTDARRRDGSLTDTDAGTWFASAVASVTKRGLDPEEPDEWFNVEEMTQPDDLASELAADDHRQVGTERWRATSLNAVEDALSRGLGVAIAAGVKGPYFDFFSTRRSPDETDIVLTNSALGGYSNGHEQRLIAVSREAGRRVWVIQNSWGHSGGCHMPDGSFEPGCAKVDDSVLLGAWDIDVIEIRG